MRPEMQTLGQPMLVAVRDGQEIVYERSFPKTPISIGRSWDCDIPLPQFPWLSRHHIEIREIEQRYYVVDLSGSQMLTFAGQPRKRIELVPGASFQVGRLTIEFGGVPTAQATEVYPTLPVRALPKPGTKPASVKPEPTPVPTNAIAPRRRAVEVTLLWHDQVYDSRVYFPGELISVGTAREDLYVPFLNGSFALGKVVDRQVEVHLRRGTFGAVIKGRGRQERFADLIQKGFLPMSGDTYRLRLNADDHCLVELGHDLQAMIRYVNAPRQLSRKVAREPDQVLRKAVLSSSTVHVLFLLLALILAPKIDGPKTKILPPRVAKLLLPKTEAPPPEPEPVVAQVAPPEAPKVAPEKPPRLPPKRVPPRPKRVVVKPVETLKVVNRLPATDVTKIGALAALGAISPTPRNSNQPLAINVNRAAGGSVSAKNPQGVIGALRTPGGKLSAQGPVGIKTSGKGFGTGQDYGVQGLQGRAGRRGVAGAVIGQPKLMDSVKVEGLTQKQVMDEVKKHLAKIQQCYEQALLSQAELSGRAEYEWEIQASGKVQWVRVKRSDLQSGEQLNTCVTDVFRKMRFPVASNGQTTTPSIGFPFGRY